MLNIELNKEKFLLIVKNSALMNREGIDDLLANILNNDFFDAPASSKYHLSEKGGLCQHSLNVYENLSNLCQLYYEDCPQDTIILVALFHDLCKMNMYKETIKNVNKNGTWMKCLAYEVDEDFPIGHGEKSVILLQQYIKLTKEEIYAIRFHMGAFDNATKGGDFGLSNTFNKPEGKLVTLLICADLIASNILENN